MTAAAGFDDKEFRDLLEALRFVHGYDFTDYAESSVKRRVLHFMELHQFDCVESMGKVLLKDALVFAEFVENISVTVTEMFRDPSFYKHIRDHAVNYLATYPMIKLWIAGCATGQEVYSFAILLAEEGLLERTIIYATDINQSSLRSARQGIYPIESLQRYTQNYQAAGGRGDFSRYYKAKHNAVLIDTSLSQNIIFSTHNLATDQSFNEFQMIVCRNVIMYFNQNLQNRVVRLFYESLCPFGFLALGDKESLMFSEQRNHFQEISRKEKIYRRVDTTV